MLNYNELHNLIRIENMINQENIPSISIDAIQKLNEGDILNALNPDSIAPSNALDKGPTETEPSNAPSKESEFKCFQLGRRIIEYRNWKVKDRLLLKKAFRTNDSDKQAEATLQILVWNCLKEKVPLNKDELEYLFANIRASSIGPSVDFKYTCSNPECSKLNTECMRISNIWKPKFKTKLCDISVNNITIEVQEVQNANYYNKKMLENDYSSMWDLILHIKTINSQTLKEAEILELFENLDTKDADAILENWENQVFSIDRVNTLVCPKCGFNNEFEFDEIPELIPPIWFKR